MRSTKEDGGPTIPPVIQVNPEAVRADEPNSILLKLQDLLDHRDRIQARIDELARKLEEANKRHHQPRLFNDPPAR